jgi:hypothetical protein
MNYINSTVFVRNAANMQLTKTLKIRKGNTNLDLDFNRDSATRFVTFVFQTIPPEPLIPF